MLLLNSLIFLFIQINFGLFIPISQQNNGHFEPINQGQAVNCDFFNNLTSNVIDEVKNDNFLTQSLYDYCCLKSKFDLNANFDCEVNECSSYKSQLCQIASLNNSFIKSLANSMDKCQCCIFHNILPALLDQALSQASQVFKLKSANKNISN